MKIRKILSAIVFILLAATLAFIWGNSLESVGESSAKSAGMLGFMTPFLEIFFGRGNVTEHIVRKIAHFTEFGALGCELTLLGVLHSRLRIPDILNYLFAGLSAAVVDEALQIISHRGSRVQDVLLDFSGVVAGTAVVLLILIIIHRIRRSAR